MGLFVGRTVGAAVGLTVTGAFVGRGVGRAVGFAEDGFRVGTDVDVPYPPLCAGGSVGRVGGCVEGTGASVGRYDSVGLLVYGARIPQSAQSNP